MAFVEAATEAEAGLMRELIITCLSPDVDQKAKVTAVRTLNAIPLPVHWSGWDEDTKIVMRRILNAVKSTEFIADLKGYKFLSKFMAAYPDKIASIHHAVLLTMQTLPNMTRTGYYGSMYVLAWRKSGSEGRREIRVQCVENLVQHMMGLSRTDESYELGELNLRLFFIIEYFLDKSATLPDVASMMSEVMDSIMTPHLKGAGTVWRCNAADAMFMAYPLESPRHTPEQREDSLNEQLEAMLSLLSDSSHYVRYTAVRGVFKTLSRYWNVIPACMRNRFLKVLFSDRTRDGDTRVREQVFLYARKLLSTPTGSAALQKLLPEVRNCFHDVSSAVRLAFIQLLMAIKERGIFPFYDAVSLDHLVAQLGQEEVNENCTLLVRFLLPYFCPLEEPAVTLFRRVFALYRMNKRALWRMYSEGILSSKEACKLISCVLNSVNEAALGRNLETGTSGRSGRRGKSRGRNKKTSTDSAHRPTRVLPAELMTPSDPEGAAALLQVVCILWKTHVEGLGAGLDESGDDELDKTREALVITLTEVMPNIQRAFRGTVVQPSLDAISRMCGSMEESTVLKEVMQTVTSATEENGHEIILKCLDTIRESRGAMSELLLVLSEAISSAWGRVSSRCSSGALPSSQAALIMLQTLCETEKCNVILEQHSDAVIDLLETMKKVQTLLVTRLNVGSPLTLRRKPALTDGFLWHAFELYTSIRIMVHSKTKTAEGRAAGIPFGIELLDWAERFLVPRLPDPEQAEQTPGSGQGAEERPLVVRALRQVLLSIGLMIRARVYDDLLVQSCLEFCHLLLAPAVKCLDFHTYIVDLAVHSLRIFKDKKEGPEGVQSGLMRNHVHPIVCALLDIVPELCAEPATRGGAVDGKTAEDAVLMTASLVCQTFLACELFFSHDHELQSGICDAIFRNVYKIVHREKDHLLSSKHLADLPHSCGYLLAPLLETASRCRQLVESMTSRSIAVESSTMSLIVNALKSQVGEGNLRDSLATVM